MPVLPPRVAVVDIGDPPTSAVVGTFVLTATALDRRISRCRGAVVWTSSDAAVAVVTAEGWVAALRTGTVVLTASCEGVRAMVRIAVVAGRRGLAGRAHAASLRRAGGPGAGAGAVCWLGWPSSRQDWCGSRSVRGR